MRILFIIILLSFAFSCVKEVAYETDHSQKLVLNSIFSPDSVISLGFSQSNIITAQSGFGLTPLNVRLWRDNELLIDSMLITDRLVTDIYPQANSCYKVEAKSIALGNITAIDTIPYAVIIQSAELKFPAGVDEFGTYWGEAAISFIDPKGISNYYEILVYNDNESYWSDSYDYEVTDPVVLNEGDIDYIPTSCFFSDELIDGEKYTLHLKGSCGSQEGDDGIVPSGNYFVELRSVSKAYYHYRKYYTRHKFNQQVEGDFMDVIYKGEPQTMYSNIDNGYGIFAAYQRSIATLQHVK